MLTINDIFGFMYINGKCPHYVQNCQFCEKYNFCWYDSLRIAKDYIEREGTI